MKYMSTEFGVDSSSCFSSIVWTNAKTHRQTHKHTNATDHPTHTSATAGIGKFDYNYQALVSITKAINIHMTLTGCRTALLLHSLCFPFHQMCTHTHTYTQL